MPGVVTNALAKDVSIVVLLASIWGAAWVFSRRKPPGAVSAPVLSKIKNDIKGKVVAEPVATPAKKKRPETIGDLYSPEPVGKTGYWEGLYNYNNAFNVHGNHTTASKIVDWANYGRGFGGKGVGGNWQEGYDGGILPWLFDGGFSEGGVQESGNPSLPWDFRSDHLKKLQEADQQAGIQYAQNLIDEVQIAKDTELAATKESYAAREADAAEVLSRADRGTRKFDTAARDETNARKVLDYGRKTHTEQKFFEPSFLLSKEGQKAVSDEIAVSDKRWVDTWL